MPRSPFHVPRPKLLSPGGRWLAAVQLAKETLTIVLLGLPLLWNKPLLAPAAVPGLVLYLFRWVMVLGRVPRRAAASIWLLTLLDELWGLGLFFDAYDAPTAWQLRYVKWTYGLGLACCLAALLEIAYRRHREQRKLHRTLLRTA